MATSPTPTATVRIQRPLAMSRNVSVRGPRSTVTMTHAPRVQRPCAAVYWRRRVVAVGLALAIFGVGRQAGAALGGSSPATPERHPQVVSYVVQPGDTLWSIAEQVAPNEDPRGVIDALRDSRDSDVLFPGEAITWLSD